MDGGTLPFVDLFVRKNKHGRWDDDSLLVNLGIVLGELEIEGANPFKYLLVGYKEYEIQVPFDRRLHLTRCLLAAVVHPIKAGDIFRYFTTFIQDNMDSHVFLNPPWEMNNKC